MVRDAPVKRKGLALQVDLVLFMLCIAILIGGVLYMLSGSSDDTKYAKAKSELALIAVAVNQYAYDMKAAPGDLKLLGSSGTRDEVTYGPWLQRETLKDPWGYLYHINPVTENSGTSTVYVGYIVYSTGPDGKGSAPTVNSFNDTNNRRIGAYTGQSEDDRTIAYYGRFGTPLTSINN